MFNIFSQATNKQIIENKTNSRIEVSMKSSGKTYTESLLAGETKEIHVRKSVV